MRVLEFCVRGQEITQAPGCDFSGLVRGTRGYLRARFSFDEEWDGCLMAASFFDAGGKETGAMIANGECEIPEEALTGSSFFVSVTGLKRGYRIRTAKLMVRQGG